MSLPHLLLLNFALAAYLTGLGQLALVVFVGLVTFFVSVPFHNRLERGGYGYVVIDGLTRTNWLHTLAWTARAAWLGAVMW